MKFSVKDRIIIPPILPEQGSYTTMIVRKDLLEKITLTQDELDEFEIKIQDSKITWSEEKAKEVDIELTDRELTLLKDSLKKLDDEEKITDDFIDIYKRVLA